MKYHFWVLSLAGMLIYSCGEKPISGPIHFHIDAVLDPGGQPVEGAGFIFAGYYKGTYDDLSGNNLDYEQITTLITNNAGIIDTVIDPEVLYREYYRFEIYPVDSASGNYWTVPVDPKYIIEEFGSYTYHVVYASPSYLRFNVNFKPGNVGGLKIIGPFESFISYSDNLNDTIIILKVVSGTQENLLRIYWSGSNNEIASVYTNLIAFDTLDLSLIQP